MGFFSDLKEDLSQAVNELMPEDGKNKADEPTDESGISLDEMLKNIDDIQFTEEMESEVSNPAETSYDFSSTAVQEGTAELASPEELPAWQEDAEGLATTEELPAWQNDAEGLTTPEELPAWQNDAEGLTTPEELPAWQNDAESLTSPEELPAWQDDAEGLTTPEELPAWQDNAESFTASETDPDSQEDSETDGEMEQLLAEMMGENSEGGVEPEAPQEEMQSETIIIEESKGEEEEMDMGDMELERDQVVSDETSVITEGMTITGDISTQGSIDVIGTVNGNIDALGKLNITGHINGNSKAAEIYAESAKINGEIVSEGAVKIGASSVIIGNITATSAAVAGAVKGDIDVKGPVILDASAIVMGNIKSKSVQINNGAVIEGMCSQCYADVSPTSFFEEYKSEPVRKPRTKQSDK